MARPGWEVDAMILTIRFKYEEERLSEKVIIGRIYIYIFFVFMMIYEYVLLCWINKINEIYLIVQHVILDNLNKSGTKRVINYSLKLIFF